MVKNYYLTFLIFCCALSFGFGQILTFDFNGLAGNEASANSNFNDANLSASVITRGVGLSAANNGGRFNATNWAVTNIGNAISGDNYMEFSLSPSSGFQFDITTVVVNFQRSGTGPRGIVLRSSLDGYASDIDGEKAIADIPSTQVISFTVNHTNRTSPVTYRVYGWAEATGGSGGFEGSGNDIIVNGSVTSTTPIPTLTASPNTLMGLDYTFNTGPSAPQSFDVTGNLLVAGTTVTSTSTDFEVSLTPVGGYANFVNVPAGTLNGTTTIYTQLAAGLPVNTYNNTITISNATVGLGSTPIINVSGEVTAPLADVVITEIMYNPPGNDDYEWIEICNLNGTAQDVSNYNIAVNGTTRFTFPSSTSIPANSCIVILLGHLVSSPAPICAFPPDYSNPIGTTNVLPNTQATITIESSTSILIDSVFYDDDDNLDTDGFGSSFHVMDATLDNSDTVANWQGVINGGSPGVNSLTPSCLFPDINVEGNVGAFPDITGDGSNIPVGFNNTLFAATALGIATPPTKSYRIQNTGAEVLNISSIALSGTNPGDFTVSNIPTTVGVGMVETFDIEFNPSAIGDRTAIVTIVSDDPDAFENPYEFNIKGTGVCTSATISVSSFAPIEGPVGTEVTIFGNGFSTTSVVTIGGIPASVISATANVLVVEIPAITNSGPFTITEGACFTISSDFILISDNVSCGLTDLIMTEIFDEDGFSLGYIEVYNGTGNTIDLSNYYIRRYGDAQDFIDDFYTDYYFSPNQDFINDGETLFGRISTDANIVTPDFDFTNVGGFPGINGEDIFHLYNATTLIDVFVIPDNDVGYTAARNTNTAGPDITAPYEWSYSNTESTADLGTFSYVQVIDRPVLISPSDFSSCGSFAEFVVNATPDNIANTLTYQWYYNEGNGIDLDWELVSAIVFPTATGINTDTLTLSGDFYVYNGYQFYCLVTEDGACGIASDAAQLTSPAATWMSGTWNYTDGTPIGTAPSINTTVIIAEDYDTAVDGNIDACNLIVNDNVTLNITGEFNANVRYVQVENDVAIVDDLDANSTYGSINIEPQGSFVQINDTGSVSAFEPSEMVVNKKTAPALTANEYTYWSSPVVGETIGNALFLSNPNRRYWFNAQNYLDAYSETSNLNVFSLGQDDIDDAFPNPADDWQQITLASTVMQPGVGYAATHDPGAFACTPGPGCPDPRPGVRYAFSGLFNNGEILVPIYRNDEERNDNNWNLIGNPYPSAIAINGPNGFLTQNTAIINGTVTGGAIDGAIFLWSQSSVPLNTTNGNENINFSQSDYAIVNGLGGVAAGGDANGDGAIDNADRPSEFIPSGQSFFIAMSDTSPIYDGSPTIKTTNVVFNNAMRSIGNNEQFFRNSNDPSTNLENKLWLNLETDNGVFNEILIGYTENATDGDDGMYYDAPRNASTNVNSVIYSLLPNVDKKFAIQGKNSNSLSQDEIIPLGFYTSINEATIYSLSIGQLEGDFMSNSPIYIIDNLYNTIHDLTASDYNFSSEIGEFNYRFQIVFRADALSVGDQVLEANDLTIRELSDGNVEFSIGSNQTIATVEILDLTGRVVYKLKGNASTEVYNLSQLSAAAYIAKVTLSNGQLLTKKAIKQQ